LGRNVAYFFAFAASFGSPALMIISKLTVSRDNNPRVNPLMIPATITNAKQTIKSIINLNPVSLCSEACCSNVVPALI
jgi:hypothetical protein